MTAVEADDMARAHRALAAADLSDFIRGHASQRAASGDGIVIKSSGWVFEEIGPLIWSDDEEVCAKRSVVFQPFAKTYRYLVDVGQRLHERAIDNVRSGQMLPSEAQR